MRRVNERIDALLLVGGFSESEYLYNRVKVRKDRVASLDANLTLPFLPQDRFWRRIKVIARPPDADTATVRGAAQYGLAGRPLVSSIVVPRSYIMKVRRSFRDRVLPSHVLPHSHA